MKRLIIIMLLVVGAIGTAAAQPHLQGPQGPQGGPQGPRPQGREHGGKDLFEFQTKAIVRHLELSEQDEVKFTKLYSEYCEQIKAIHPKVEDKPQKGKEEPSDEQIEQQILDSFEIAEKSTALKKEYYPMFREILSAHQILKMYNIERQIGDRLNSEIENRANRTPPGGRNR